MAKLNKEALAKKFKEVGATETIVSGYESITAFVNGMAEVLETLNEGDEIVLNGLGKFYVFQTAERTGRNPQKPEDIYTIPSEKVLKFKMSKSLKDTNNL